MTTTTVGSLCTGYGGLDLAAALIWPDAQLLYTSESDPKAAHVVDARLCTVPNLGDLRAVDNPPPADIVTAGFPCQAVSGAGRQKGLEDDRWLWPDIEAFVSRMDPPPRLLLLENVPRLLTVNGGNAMASIVSSLARLGYMGRYRLLPAADVGACHRRQRWFAVAAHTSRTRRRQKTRGASQDEVPALRAGRVEPHADNQPGGPRPGRLLPSPQASDGTRGPDYARARNRRATHGSGGDDLTTAIAKLLPTPTARDHKGAWSTGSGVDLSNTVSRLTTTTRSTISDNWGPYADAITRHAETIGRPPPPPADDKRRLAPTFVEWMMMLPAGWVTDLDLSRTAQLTILGNGVIPIQAAAAYRELLEGMIR